MSRRDVNLPVGMARPPPVVCRLMRVQIVDDHVERSARIRGGDAIQEVQEFDAPPAPIMSGLNQARGHVHGGKEASGAMPLVGQFAGKIEVSWDAAFAQTGKGIS